MSDLNRERPESGPMGRFTVEITTSLIAGALGMAFAGPAGAVTGAVVGAVSGAIGQHYLTQKNQGPRPR
jgi:hypothetical protein